MDNRGEGCYGRPVCTVSLLEQITAGLVLSHPGPCSRDRERLHLNSPLFSHLQDHREQPSNTIPPTRQNFAVGWKWDVIYQTTNKIKTEEKENREMSLTLKTFENMSVMHIKQWSGEKKHRMPCDAAETGPALRRGCEPRPASPSARPHRAPRPRQRLHPSRGHRPRPRPPSLREE